MNISFYLDKPRLSQTVVMVDIAVNAHRLRKSTGVSIDTKHWNRKHKAICEDDPVHTAKQQRLDKLETHIKKIYRNTVSDGDTLESSQRWNIFKQEVIKLLKQNKHEVAPLDFFAQFKVFIDTHMVRAKNGAVQNKRPGSGSIRRYTQCKNSLAEFAHNNKYELTFDSIDSDFYIRFTTWLLRKQEITDATLGNYIKTLKTFMASTADKGLHTNYEFLKFYKPSSKNKKRALTLDQFKKLRDYDLGDNLRLRRVRDTFLIQTYTGMRYEDMANLLPKNFDLTNGFVRAMTSKTATVPVIPITIPLRNLLEQYPSLHLEYNSIVKQNLYLKELCKLVGLDSPTIRMQTKQGITKSEVVPLYTQITTHTARRTFASISATLGLHNAVIARVLGHTTEKSTTDIYIDLDESTVQNLVCKAWAQVN